MELKNKSAHKTLVQLFLERGIQHHPPFQQPCFIICLCNMINSYLESDF